MKINKSQSTNRTYRLQWFALGLLTILASAIARPSYKITEYNRFSMHSEHVEAIVIRWRYPTDVAVFTDDNDLALWVGAWTALYNATGNVCNTPDDVSFTQMKSLVEYFESLDRSPIIPETLNQAWTRLGETGPNGRKYVSQMRPLFDEYYLPLKK